MFNFDFENFAVGFIAGVTYMLIMIEIAERKRKRRSQN